MKQSISLSVKLKPLSQKQIILLFCSNIFGFEIDFYECLRFIQKNQRSTSQQKVQSTVSYVTKSNGVFSIVENNLLLRRKLTRESRRQWRKWRVARSRETTPTTASFSTSADRIRASLELEAKQGAGSDTSHPKHDRGCCDKKRSGASTRVSGEDRRPKSEGRKRQAHSGLKL